MSEVVVAGVATSRDTDQLDILPFSDRSVAYQVPYVRLSLEPCDGSEPFSSSYRSMRIAREGNYLVWRKTDGANRWIVTAERILFDLETGEQSVRFTSESIQVGDVVYVQEFTVNNLPQRCYQGRVKHICIVVC